LVLAVVIPSSRHAYTWLRRISANKQLNVNGRLDHPENSADPQVLLTEANHLYWLNNGRKQRPLYAKAEIRWVYLPAAIRKLPENAWAVASLPAVSSRRLSLRFSR
jgi:hypothetical protein